MSSRHEQELGLEGQHSYVVLDMRKTDDERLLLVKNPWAEGRGWRGPRPSVEPLLDASTPNAVTNSVEVYHQDSLPSTKRPHPTTFYIALEHVIQHFESLYLNWNPVLFQYRQDIHFDWEIDELKGENTCIVSQPQFSFWSKDEKEVWFLLTRHFRETCMNIKDESDAFNDGSIRPDVPVYSAEDAVMGYMSIYVCTGNGQRIYIKDTYLESSDYVTTPQCLLRWDTDADSRYTVVVDQENLPPSKYTFTLSAFSNSEMTLDPAANKYPFQKILAGEWMKETAGGSTTSTMYLDNPQFSLEVKNSGPLAILLTGADKKSLLHVKLAIGYGKRMHRLQTRDVLVDSGDHRPGCVFAEMEDVSPGRYTIICSLFEPGQTGEFTLRVDSTSDVVLKEIAREGAGMFYRKLSPVCFGPGVNKIAAPLVLHRLASYTIIARFQQAMISHSLEQPLGHSPFRFSIERGRGPESSFLIASEGGNYTSTAMARTEAVDMDPCLYKTGDLWLVFDRLSSSSAAVEWYDIEMYHDVPGACSVGVWRNWDT
jgi:calpain-7